MMQLKNRTSKYRRVFRNGKTQYVIILRPAPNYGNPNTHEIVNQHFNYLKDLLRKGILTMAGKFLDVLFGLVMIEVNSRDEAVSIMENDLALKRKYSMLNLINGVLH